MKLQIEVNLDWLDENGSLDEQVKQEIADRIAERISATAVKDVRECAIDQVHDKLDVLITELFQGFMNETVTVTDEWGKPRYASTKIAELMRKKLDRALGEKINDRGELSSYGNYTRLEWLFDTKVRETVAKTGEAIAAQAKKLAEKTLVEAMSAKLSGALLAQVDIGKILSEAAAKKD